MHPIALALILALTHGNIPSIGSTNHQHVVTRRHHRRIFFYSPVKGSHESLLRQNLRVSEDDLERIQDDAQLEELTRNGELVGLPQNQFMGVDPKLPEERRFCRPWTKNFLDDLGQKYFSQFRQRVFHVTVYRDYETEMQQSASASSAARSE